MAITTEWAGQWGRAVWSRVEGRVVWRAGQCGAGQCGVEGRVVWRAVCRAGQCGAGQCGHGLRQSMGGEMISRKPKRKDIFSKLNFKLNLGSDVDPGEH